MAEKRDVRMFELDAVERGYVVEGLARLVGIIRRNKANQPAGTDLWHAFDRELVRLEDVSKKFR